MNSPRIEGVAPVLNTPMTADGAIDHAGLERLVDFLAKKPIAGLWVLGTGSEDMNLTFAKRLEVARTVAKAVNGRTPIILGAGFSAMEEGLDFMEQTADLPVDGYHVMTYHPLLGLDRVEWMYKRMADACPKPLWLYYSSNWSRPMPPDFVARMKGYPNIAGVKYSTKNSVDNLKVISLADDDFQVITAVAGQFYACLCMGVKAHTTSLGSSMPDTLINIYELFRAGKMDECLKAQKRLNKFMAAMPTDARSSNFLMGAEEKYILKLRGICEEHVSSYYKGLSEENKRLIERLVKDYDIIK